MRNSGKSAEACTRSGKGRPRLGVKRYSSTPSPWCSVYSSASGSRTISQRSRSRKSASRPAPLTRTTALNTPSGTVLERQRQARAELRHLAALDLDVELGDFRDAQVAQRFRRGLHRASRRILPGRAAGADDIGDAVDRIAAF